MHKIGAKDNLVAALTVLSNKFEVIAQHSLLVSVYYPTLQTAQTLLGSAISGPVSQFLSSHEPKVTHAKALLNNQLHTSPVVLPDNVAWESVGLISSLKLIFSASLQSIFAPLCATTPDLITAVIMRCNNPQFGDFQCNNALQLSRHLKAFPGYSSK